MRWTDRDVRRALALEPGEGAVPDASFVDIGTDTRTLAPGSLFVALQGERHDGHAYLAAARDAGARAAVVRRQTPMPDGLAAYEVEDTLVGYGLLARHRRRAIAGPVVAVTGTNGKTSTKELLAAALGTRYRVHRTRANLNNLVGVPQTILEAPDDVDALVVEAGASVPGEVARYRTIIEPDLSVITNVAAGHLEGFGSADGVMREKLALAQDVAVAVVGEHPPDLGVRARAIARRAIVAGLEAGDVVPDRVHVDAEGRATLSVDGRTVPLRLRGLHQAANALLAWVVARELGLDLDRVARALASVTIPGGRGELVEQGGFTILNDCYNANPASFHAVIELVRALRGGRPLVFVAGTMRELGPESEAFHAEIAAELVALDPDLLAAVGAFGPALARWREALGDRLLIAPDATTMGRLLAPRLTGGELIVLKGSRGEALERMLPQLLDRTDATG